MRQSSQTFDLGSDTPTFAYMSDEDHSIEVEDGCRISLC